MAKTGALLAASVAVALVAGGLYSHPKMLNGEFVYDDGGTVTGNPVSEMRPWRATDLLSSYESDQSMEDRQGNSDRRGSRNPPRPSHQSG